MSRFKRVGHAIQCTFHRAEYELLTALHHELGGLVSDADPADPRFRRLFPPAVLDALTTEPPTPDARLVSWRDQSLATAHTWLESATHHRGIYRLTIAIDDVDAFLQLVNDMRLMLGASIDVEAFDRDGLAADDERQYPLAIIDHLAWWQEELLSLLADDDTTSGATP